MRVMQFNSFLLRPDFFLLQYEIYASKGEKKHTITYM